MKYAIPFVLVLMTLVLLAGCTQNTASPQPPVTTPSSTPPASAPTPVLAASIHITENGFEPAQVTILKGGTVTWVNDFSALVWPASAMHPTHTVYPGSDITKCGTADQQGIFDACTGIAQGASWSFVFDQVGEWGYHDHLNARHFGKINVTQ